MATLKSHWRRKFLKNTLMLAGGMALPALVGTAWFGKNGFGSGAFAAQGRRVERVGVQLYTLRAEMAKDFQGTLEKVAELGYQEVEFAGYFDHSGTQVRSILDGLGMTSPATHIGMQLLQNELQATIETSAAIGQSYIILPAIGGDLRNTEGYKKVATFLNRTGETCKQAGIQLGYHNHDFEFASDNGQIGYDILLEETDPELVTMEMDLYWIAFAGADPVTYFNNYPGRFSLLHIKDMTADKRMVDVGEGILDFAELFSHIDTAGFKHYFVEHDRPDVALESIAVSIKAVKSLVF